MQIKIIVSTRIDKFLWATRHYKTRSLASEDIGKGRVKVNGAVVKPSREVRAGDMVDLLQGGMICTFKVLQVSDQRGPAPQAQTLFEESAQSIQARENTQEQRRLHPEPALSIQQGRPTKRQRRDLENAKNPNQRNTGWDSRWSASLD